MAAIAAGRPALSATRPSAGPEAADSDASPRHAELVQSDALYAELAATQFNAA